jgi:hypothetical protein
MRRFETDYAGAWRGFCNTRESAVVAAIRRIMNDGYSRCTITDRETGETVARLTLDGDKRGVEVITKTVIQKVRR